MQNKKLKFALLANAAFSCISALSMLFFHTAIAEWMAITEPLILFFIGVGLLLFALSLIHTAFQKGISSKKVKMIIFQDWMWVLGSLLIILTQAFGLNFNAYVLIGVVALIVADFAILQHKYLKVNPRSN